MGARILIVDDDAELCELLREYLEGEGFGVSTPSTRARAFAD